MNVAVAVAAVVGIIVGVLVGLRLSRWSLARARPDAEDVEDGPRSASDGEASGLLREAVEHLEVGVLVAGPDGGVSYRNGAASEFRGTHVGVLVDDHVAEVIEAARAGVQASRVVDLQGPPKVWLEISADRLPSGGVVVTIRDISERVRTDSMRSDFVTNISHELKTPVGAVAVLAEALVDESDPAVVHRLADHLVDEAHRAVRTIDDLLKLSEIESRRTVDEVVDVKAVVARAIGRGRTIESGRGVQITALDVPDDLLVRGDELQLLSAVGNLVENAVKYSHEGGVVQVRVRVDAAAVEIMVADQGVGIPARDLDRVFERFHRVDRARSRETGGTGLGLAIVRHVATNHGGDVLVSSQEGEGSTFVLRLPASLVVQPGSATSMHEGQERQRRE